MADSTKYSSYTEFIFRWNNDLASISYLTDTDENDKLYRIGRYAFANTSLVSLDFPNCSYIGGNAFSSCSSLETANFSNCKTIEGCAFWFCTNLNTISFPNCNYIGWSAFIGCSKLTVASFPNCKIMSGGVFSQCSSLTTAYFPVCESIGYLTFAGRRNLTSIYFPKCKIVGELAFANCTQLLSADFPYCQVLSASAFQGCTSLSMASFQNCSYIGSWAFSACYNLLSLYLLASSVAVMSYSYTFISTPIGGYTTSTSGVYGSIYVPVSLLTAYKSATNWVYFSSRFTCLVANLVLDGATENTIVTNGEEIVDTSSLYCDGTTLYAYNKDWGKVTIDNPMDTNAGTTVTKTITVPTDYITVTYSGISDTVNASVKSIKLSYEGIDFTYDTFPVTLALPKTGAEVTFNATFTGYSKISRIDTISATTTITLADPEVATYEIVDITAENGTDYTTLVDGSNFVVNGDYITNGSVSYNVNNGHSKGYITFTTPSTMPDDCTCVTIKCYASSESNYDFGYVYISASDTPTYASTYSNVRSATASSTLSGYMAKSAGNNSSVSTFTSGTLATDTTYTLSFGYIKDSSGNSNSDRFYIQEIIFPQAS